MRVWDYKGLVICFLAVSCADSGDTPDDSTAPEIQSVQPAAGPTNGGATVTVKGRRFPKDAIVKFNDVLATSIRVLDDGNIQATLPPSDKVGKVTVAVSLPDGRNAMRGDVFSYYYGVIDFPIMPALPTGRGPRAVLLKDVDNDNHVDLITANGNESSISLFLGQAGSSFAPEVRISTPQALSALGIADVDGDGKQDLIATSEGANEIYTLRGSGQNPPFSAVTATSVGQVPSALVLGDLNGDSKVDVAVANEVSNNLSILLNSGGMWNAQPPVSAPGLPFGMALGDLNRDGKPDLAVSGYQNGIVQIFTNSGNATFTPGDSLDLGARPRVIGLIDLNRDGIVDISAVSETKGGVSVVLGKTGGGYTAPQSYGDGSFPSQVAVKDINGDGLVDLVVASTGKSSVIVLPGRGDGTFGDAQNIPCRIMPAGLDIADVDNDGRLDLAVISTATSEALVLLNKSR